MSLPFYLPWRVVTLATVLFLQHQFPPFVRKTPPPVAPFVLILSKLLANGVVGHFQSLALGNQSQWSILIGTKYQTDEYLQVIVATLHLRHNSSGG